jgi:hypothetical protein
METHKKTIFHLIQVAMADVYVWVHGLNLSLFTSQPE